MGRPLDGMTIIDLTTIVLGPYATMLLADLGARVIKIENLDGDVLRGAEPARNSGMGAVFMNCNRGKESVAINLKEPDGHALLMRLVATADGFIHSMRRGATGRINIGYDAIRAVNPGIVYCVASGYDATGPQADDPAYDDVIQAATTVAALNQDADGRPRFLPSILADKIAGIFAANAMLGGLLHRTRTGAGQYIEIPMMECMASFMLLEHMAGRVFEDEGWAPGYRRALSSGRRPYKTRDGYIAVLPYTAAQWQRILHELGRRDLADAAWVADAAQRSARIDTLYTVLNESLSARTTKAWQETFRRLDLPHARINDIDDMLCDPQLIASDFFEVYDHPTEGRLRGNRHPVRYGAAPRARTPPTAPRLGEHTRSVLVGIGADDAEIERLGAAGVIAATWTHD